MLRKATSQTGMFTLRGVIACALFTVAVVLGTFSWRSFAAATPPSGTLDTSTPGLSITYTDGPLAPNPSGVAPPPVCNGAPTAPTCSDFTVTVNASSLAATHNFTWTVQWPHPNVDMDIFVEDGSGNLIANNNSTTDPSAILLPIPANGTVYHLVVASSVGVDTTLTGTVSLTPKYPTSGQGAGAPPRYMHYPAAPSQGNGANEPSIGVDWNPNVASLKHDQVNTGGVAFFTVGSKDYRVNFDDCCSPALNPWEDVSATFTKTFVLSDPIGFVDHFSSSEMGLGPIPPLNPGRVFSINLIGGQGNSLGSYSDNDGNSYLPGANGGAPEGPDHETLGGGPYHSANPAPVHPLYPNAIYYCSQNTVQNAECSRSDDGGQTFGPGVLLFDPQVCGGGIHGHVKVSPQGTAYVPNSSCAAGGGANGVGRTTDNGMTWHEFNVPNSTGSEDPAIGIGQNSVGKPIGQGPNTIYLGWISADNHAHAAHSGDEGATWADDIDVSSIFGIRRAVFPIVVAGDDNRAAYAFLGTYPAIADKDVWHLYVATTYDGGHSWILTDTTPDDPVQIGVICLLGLSCTSSNRNLLDFNGIDIDSEGRVLIAYTDGCPNCSNTQNITQSSQAHAVVGRQAGGRRLFSAFDSQPQTAGNWPPAAPQVLTAVRQSSPSGVAVTWLKPDNGGSPILSYNIYRGTTSGGESNTPLATVTGADTNKFLDTTADSSTNYFYRVAAVNSVGEGAFCREVSINGPGSARTACVAPYLQQGGSGSFVAPLTSDPTQGQMTIQNINMGEPFVSCTDNSLTFTMKVQNLNPQPVANGIWKILFNTKDTTNVTRTVFVEMDTTLSPTPSFNYGYFDSSSGSTTQCFLSPTLTSCAATGSFASDGTITIKLDVSQPLEFFSSTNTNGIPDFVVNIPVGTALTAVSGETDVLIGAVGTGRIEKVQTDGGSSTYTRIGSTTGCNTLLPVAILTANPMSGSPGVSVNFNGTTSFEPSGACGTINSYTIDFGDGSATATNNTGLFNHSYSNPGNYPARLTVTDSIGHASVNAAQVVIAVAGTPPPVSSVVSRKTHAGTPYDVALQTTANTQPRGVECRSGGASGDHSIVFTFQNNLVADVNTAASVIVGPGSVVTTGTGIGPAANQYTVNLTGVTNGQYVTVAIDNAHDSAGNIGVVATTMGALVGDTTGDGSVNSADISQTKSRSGQVLSTTNFRSDVTVEGSINSADISSVKSRSGTALPSAP